jgi:cytochrome P450
VRGFGGLLLVLVIGAIARFAVWIIARRAIEDDLIGGHHIRRGTTVVIPIHHIHHDPRWWPDPETFDPTRFCPPDKDRPRSAYLPFGGGRRICIGQSFALMEMVLRAAIMSQRFTFDLAPDYPVELEATVGRGSGSTPRCWPPTSTTNTTCGGCKRIPVAESPPGS